MEVTKPLPAKLTQAQIEVLLSDDEAREQFEQAVKREYEALCEAHGVHGLRALAKSLAEAQSGFKRSRDVGDESTASKYLATAVTAADKLALRLERLEDRRMKRDAVGELSANARPVIEMVPVGDV